VECPNSTGTGWLIAVLNARQSSRLRRFVPTGIVRVIAGQAGAKRIAGTDRSRQAGSIQLTDGRSLNPYAPSTPYLCA
jgi:hypothetical protein